MNKVVIWGLKSDFHSHKFIQHAFYTNALKMGYESIWVDDRESSADLINRGDIVFAVDVAARFLPVIAGARYVLHNISPESIGINNNFVKVQVHTKAAKGENLGIPYVHWDNATRTLFQPWGVPSSPKVWKKANHISTNKEFWVGSIWNNDLNQGNSDFMKGYIENLSTHNIRFLRKGTPSRFQPNGISESRATRLVNRSAIGAAVVGNWQRDNQYIPCRLFKNVAAGTIPSSNAEFYDLFNSDIGIFDSNPEILIEKILRVGQKEREERVELAQQIVLPYTYTAGMNRIFASLLS